MGKRLIDTGTVRSQDVKPLQYCLNQEKYLRVVLKDSNVPMDNNTAERAIRPFTLGRKILGRH
ncbi:MAG: IS66 family transposase [Lachnospiraceae bacterium]|nr:IS66 family transposase [Lachnospiraceae bacterium]